MISSDITSLLEVPVGESIDQFYLYNFCYLVHGLRKGSTLLCMGELNRSLQLGQWPYCAMRCCEGILKVRTLIKHDAQLPTHTDGQVDDSPSKWLRNSLVTGSHAFHHDDEGHRICMVITLIVVENLPV